MFSSNFFFPSLLVRVVCVGSSATLRPGQGKTANRVVHVHLFKTEQLSGLFRTSSTDRCKTDKCSSCTITCPNPQSPLPSHNFHLKWLPQTSCSPTEIRLHTTPPPRCPGALLSYASHARATARPLVTFICVCPVESEEVTLCLLQ